MAAFSAEQVQPRAINRGSTSPAEGGSKAPATCPEMTFGHFFVMRQGSLLVHQERQPATGPSRFRRLVRQQLMPEHAYAERTHAAAGSHLGRLTLMISLFKEHMLR